MFKNAGKIIKVLSIIFFGLGVTVSAIGGLVILIEFEPWDYEFYYLFVAMFATAAGCFASWVIALFVYGYGELVDKAGVIARNTAGTINGAVKSEAQRAAEYERISKLEKLRAEGLISEEEYIAAVSRQQ